MGNYSDYFNFGTDPTLSKVKVDKTRMSPFGFQQNIYQDVVTTGREDTRANEEFDAIMAGHDATSAQYTNTLKSIYDGYGQYAKDYEGNVQPLIDSMTGDIENMAGYIENYDELLLENKDTFLSGIVLDPNANRTRAAYTGAVADQYDNLQEQQRQQMSSQGLNPYENKGSVREMAMNRSRDMGMAEGQAYTDWRQSYNTDKERQQNATAQFIGMQGEAIKGQQGIIDAKRGITDIYGNVLNAKIGADKERASGYESLTSLAEARRQEALGLAQQGQENDRYTADITQQLNAKRVNNGARYTNF